MNAKRSKLFLFLATLGPIGYLPAPGTCGTLVTLPLIYLCNFGSRALYHQIAAIIFLIVFSFIIIKRALYVLGRNDDPSEIIIDEVVGTFITFFLVPINIKTLLLGFVLFRFFDISKLGVKNIELLFGAWGIVLDDVVAGVWANLILHMLLYYFASYLL